MITLSSDKISFAARVALFRPRYAVCRLRQCAARARVKMPSAYQTKESRRARRIESMPAMRARYVLIVRIINLAVRSSPRHGCHMRHTAAYAAAAQALCEVAVQPHV